MAPLEPVQVILTLLALSLLAHCGSGQGTPVSGETTSDAVAVSDVVNELKNMSTILHTILDKISSLDGTGGLAHCSMAKTSKAEGYDENSCSAPRLNSHSTERLRPESITRPSSDNTSQKPDNLWYTILGARHGLHAFHVTLGMMLTASVGLLLLMLLVEFCQGLARRNAAECVTFVAHVVGVPIGVCLVLWILFNICSRYLFTFIDFY